MALRFDPQALPVVGVDRHLPALASFDANELALRFRCPPRWTPDVHVELPVGTRSPVAASVLIGIVQRTEPTVLLTERTAHLNDHAGQIAFPGGRAEPEDADATATALREAHEEIGLEATFTDVLGVMPLYTTGSGFIVTPVVALVRPGFTLRADPYEVAEVFEVPLAFLMNPANHRHHAVEIDGRMREFLSMPWEGHDSAGQPRRYFIWGATAAMLRNFYRFLAA
ncbi:MAG: CoA pyrophosphatase [Pseudomonadota bacterium]|nr:CoA pyrophosphatase [Pseudomonadota bacterium]